MSKTSLFGGFRTGTPGRTLVIMDMQSGFVAFASTLPAVMEEVRRAVAAGMGVVVVRYDTPYAGDVDPRLLQLLDELGARWVFAVKTAEEGSTEVLEACRAAGFSEDILELCGVSTDCCVEQTAAGLADQLPHSRIEVITHACGTSDIRYDWNRFVRRRNLFLKGGRR